MKSFPQSPFEKKVRKSNPGALRACSSCLRRVRGHFRVAYKQRELHIKKLGPIEFQYVEPVHIALSAMSGNVCDTKSESLHFIRHNELINFRSNRNAHRSRHTEKVQAVLPKQCVSHVVANWKSDAC